MLALWVWWWWWGGWMAPPRLTPCQVIPLSGVCAGDDEQSDWFFEGECGAGTGGVAGLMPGWDSADRALGLEAERPASRRTFLQPARPPQRGEDGGLSLSVSLSLSPSKIKHRQSS